MNMHETWGECQWSLFHTLVRRSRKCWQMTNIRDNVYFLLIVNKFEFLNLPSNSVGVQSCTPFVFHEYITCLSEFSIALRRILRATKTWWNDVEIFKIVQPVINILHRKWRWCGWFFGENVIKLGDHWIKIKGRNSPLEANSMLQRLFLGCRSHSCW